MRARLSRRRIAYGGLRRETAKEKVKEEKRRRLFFMVQQENCRVLSRYQPAGPCKASRTAKASQAGKLSLSLFRSTLFLAVFHYQASTCLWSASLDLYRLGMHIADTLFNRSRIVKNICQYSIISVIFIVFCIYNARLFRTTCSNAFRVFHEFFSILSRLEFLELFPFSIMHFSPQHNNFSEINSNFWSNADFHLVDSNRNWYSNSSNSIMYKSIPLPLRAVYHKFHAIAE